METSNAIFTKYDLNIEEETFKNCHSDQIASSFSHDISSSNGYSNKSSLSSFGQRQSFLSNAKFETFYVKELSRAVQFSARDKLHGKQEKYHLKNRNAFLRFFDFLLYKFYAFMSISDIQASLLLASSILLILLSECISNITSDKILNCLEETSLVRINIHLFLLLSIVLLVICTIEEIIFTKSLKKLILGLLLMSKEFKN